MEAFLAEFAKAANVVLGWALGFASALGLLWWTKRKEARNVKKAISRELCEVAYRLLILTYKLESSHGGVNRQLLEWMHPQIQRYAGPNPKDGMLAGIGGLLKCSGSDIAKFAARQRATIGPQHWPTEQPSYTMGALGKLHDLDPDYGVRVLDVLSHIRMLNEARETGVYYLRLTFTPGLSVANYDKAEENRQSAETQAAERARIIVDKISALEERYPPDP